MLSSLKIVFILNLLTMLACIFHLSFYGYQENKDTKNLIDVVNISGLSNCVFYYENRFKGFESGREKLFFDIDYAPDYLGFIYDK